jgi:hypothetical protein
LAVCGFPSSCALTDRGQRFYTRRPVKWQPSGPWTVSLFAAVVKWRRGGPWAATLCAAARQVAAWRTVGDDSLRGGPSTGSLADRVGGDSIRGSPSSGGLADLGRRFYTRRPVKWRPSGPWTVSLFAAVVNWRTGGPWAASQYAAASQVAM